VSRSARRRLIAALVVTAALAALFAYLFGFVGGSSRDPLRLLVARPALPAVWVDASQGNAPTPIFWRRWQERTTEADECDLGRGAIRGWSDGGDVFANPDAWEKVCVHRSRFVARAFYKWQSLHRVAGEDWPNFEPDSDAPTVPTQVGRLSGLRADQWEIGCGLGDPNTLCGVWTFRARYDEVLVVMELRTNDPGLRFEAMRRFVEAVDQHIAAKIGRINGQAACPVRGSGSGSGTGSGRC
jgi:hypothetical protein